MTVYVSMPLSGPASPDGRDAADGARLALMKADGRAGDLEVQAKYLDDANPVHRWDPAAVGRNARRAAQDSSTAAYIGELDSQPTRASLPITNDAGIAQVSPGASAVDLTQPAEGYPDSPARYRPSGEVTFARVVPDDAVQARALAQWANGVGPVLGRSAGGPFGDLMLEEFTTDAEESGVEVIDPNQAKDAELLAEFVAGAGPVGPGLLTIADNGRVVSGTLEPSRLPSGSFPSDFRKRIGRRPGPYAVYGFEAMRVILEAIAAADLQDGFRASVADQVLDSDHPVSILGSYSITPEGDTTLCTVQRYTVRGTLVPNGVVCPSG